MLSELKLFGDTYKSSMFALKNYDTPQWMQSVLAPEEVTKSGINQEHFYGVPLSGLEYYTTRDGLYYFKQIYEL